MRALRFLLRKEYLQIFRDPNMIAQMLLVPIIQLALLSNAATFDVKRASLYVIDDDRTILSERLADRFSASGRFVRVPGPPSSTTADEAMLGSRASMVLHIPSDFEETLTRGATAPVQLVFDAVDGSAAGVTQSYAQEIIGDYAADLGAGGAHAIDSPERAPDRDAPARSRVEVRSRDWYNPDHDYRIFMIPGILVDLVTVAGTLLIAVNIAREKELGTLDQLNVTPVTRAQIVAAKLISLWTIALTELSFGLLVARFVFHVPMRGSVLLVLALSALYLIAALGLGVFISTLAESQQQALFLTFFVQMIYLFMSGVFTPVRSMPQWAQLLSHLNPMMYFTEIMRAILLKGAGLLDVWRTFAILLAYGLAVFTLAVRRYATRTA